jgi:uroporphyrinogen-III synthase
MRLPSDIPTVVLTHPVEQGDELVTGLQQKGIDLVIDQRIVTKGIVPNALQLTVLKQSDWVLFTSKRGVAYAFESPEILALLKQKNIACVGKKTAHALEIEGLKPSFVSSGKTGEEMADELIAAHLIDNKRVVAVLGELADETLLSKLSGICDFSRINIYRTHLETQIRPETLEKIQTGLPLIVCATSPSCFISFHNVYGNFLHSNVTFASIGPVTTRAMLASGVNPVVEGQTSTYGSLLDELLKYINLS